MSGSTTAPRSADDRSLLAELRRSRRRQDRLGPRAVAAARAAISWRTFDAQLAELTEAPEDHGGRAGVRRSVGPAMLSFEAPCLEVAVEVVPAGDRRRLVGQLAPGRSGLVQVRHRGGAVTVEADAVGRFAAEDLEPGPVSLRCEPPAGVDEPVVETDWFLA
jgi:hypothetical protein